MNELSDLNLDNDSDNDEIESPVDGPPPDWMRAATSSGSDFSEDAAPDWLKSIRSGKSTSDDPAADMEDSVSDLATADDDDDDDDSMSDLERLLAEEGIDLGTVAEERPAGSEGMSAKDWLISTSDDDLVRKRLDDDLITEFPVAEHISNLEETAPSLEETSPSPEPITATLDSSAVAEDDLPDWLQETTEEEDAITFGIDSDDEDLPDWLQETAEDEDALPIAEDMGAAESDSDMMVVEDDLPDWLQEVEEDEDSAFIETAPTGSSEPAGLAEAAVTEDDLPDWLREVEEAEDDLLFESSPTKIEPSPPTIEAPIVSAAVEDEADKMVVEDDLPDWLQEIEEADDPLLEIPAAEAPSPASEPLESVATVEDEADKMVVEDDLPDWLQEVEEEGEPLLEIPAAEAPSPASEPLESVATIEDEADKMVVEDDLPDWLQEVEDEGEPLLDIPAASDFSEPVAEDDQGAVEDDLPDWLREVEEDDAIPSGLPVSVASDDSGSDEQPVVEEELPDWLQEVEDAANEPLPDLETTPAAAVADTPDDEAEAVEETEDLPDWLQSMEAEGAESEASMVAPEAIEDEIEDEIVVEDDLPDWLQEIEEDDTLFEPSDPSPDPFTEVESVEAQGLEAEDIAEDIIEEELPDWLQQVQDEGELEETPISEPASTLPETIVAAVEDTTLDEADDPTVEEELPAWLQEIEEEEVAEPPVVAETTLPQPTLEIEEPVSAAPILDTKVAVDDNQEQIPDWLKKLREGGEQVASDVPTPAVAEVPPTPAQPQAPIVLPTIRSTPVVVEVDALPSDLPADPDERLILAQNAGEVDEAVRVYHSLVASGSHLDTVIEEVQALAQSHPESSQVYQLLGDAMMRDGRLQSALQVYRQAMSKL